MTEEGLDGGGMVAPGVSVEGVLLLIVEDKSVG